MRPLFTLFLTLLVIGGVKTQSYNTLLRSQVDFPDDANDVWGYAAPDGTEYAIVGTERGLGVVSLANPDSAYTVTYIPGQFSKWRDIKTYGEYAYVVAEQGTEGLTILDLSELPDKVNVTHNNLPVPGSSNFISAHNLFIDVPTGMLYIAGADQNNGGMLIYDLTKDPLNPEFAGFGPNVYAHDVYVQDGRMYASEIRVGRLSIYDVSDPQNVTLLSNTNTPYSYTHNAWTDATGNYVYTTDERQNASTAAYDISDPTDPVLVDEYRPIGTLGSGLIPHNVHVIDDYLSISHYSAGIVIVDASVPDNLVEVARYDTYPGEVNDFKGNWGAYPFLPSGLTLASDRSFGLFVIDVDYQRAARLKGTVTNASTGQVLNNVSITVEDSVIPNLNTEADGTFSTGLSQEGTYTVKVELDRFISQSLTVELVNGVETVLDVSLVPLGMFTVGGTVTSTTDNALLSGAELMLVGAEDTYRGNSGDDGTIALDVFEGTYDVYLAKWGFQNISLGTIDVTDNQLLELEMTPGIRDNFVQDQGWSVVNDAPRGKWVRGKPNGTFSDDGLPVAPSGDIEGDFGDQAYVTGNRDSDGVGDDDIDAGEVTLLSPLFNGLNIPEPQLSYSYWFYNDGGDGNPNDTLQVWVDNGTSRVALAYYTESGSEWRTDAIALADFIELTDSMQLLFVASDRSASGHIVEAGIDGISILPEGALSNVEDAPFVDFEAVVFPNPSNQSFQVNYRFPTHQPQQLRMDVFDAVGRKVETRLLPKFPAGNFRLGESYPLGTYFLRLTENGRTVYTEQLQKVR